MAKPGNQNHKKRYEKYKSSGRREANKALRQQRDEKRKAKFAKRKEEGRTYEYKPIPYEKGTKEYNRETRLRAEKNINHKTEYQTVVSAMQKLQNDLDKIAKEEKAAMDKTKSRKERSHQSPLRNNDADEYGDREL